MNNEQKLKLETFITSLGLTYGAIFVPFSQSRSAKENPKISDYNINWNIILSNKNKRVLKILYSLGYGHLPFDTHLKNSEVVEAIKNSCEEGKYFFGNFIKKSLVPPDLQEILYSLVSDSAVLNHSSFEEWASEFGYDIDSRSAEKVYQACLKQSLEFKMLIGQENIDTLQELFQDY